MKAIIIGAGIAGLSAAISLRQCGCDVELYEQAPAFTPMGAALSMWPNALAALDRLGCGEDVRAIAAPLSTVALAQADGRDITRFDVSKIVPGHSGYLPTRTELHTILLARLGDVVSKLGHRLASWSQDEDGVLASFADGHVAQGDLLIAADGIWSSIAREVSGVEPRHSGYGGVLALSDPVPGFPATGTGVEFWGRKQRLGVFDLSDGRKYWFFMRNEHDPAEAQTITLTEIEQTVDKWPDAVRATVAATPESRLIPFSVHAKQPPRLLGAGRVILVGDAAHAMEPNMGQGACQALEDAVALGVAALPGKADLVLSRFTAMRLNRVRRFVALSRQGSFVPHHLPAPLATASIAAMRVAFTPLAARQMRSLYRMPDYRPS